MSKPSAFANYFSFIGGIQTDMSPLNRKPVEAVDMENIYIQSDGSIRRFKGVDVISEDIKLDIPNSPVDIFYWETYNRNKEFKSYICVLNREFIYLYEPDIIKDKEINSKIRFDFKEKLGKILSNNYSYSLDGIRIVIANADFYPFYLYLDDENKLQYEELPMFVRDLSFEPLDQTNIRDELDIGKETDVDSGDNPPHTFHGITSDNEHLHYFDDLYLKVFKEGEYPSSVTCFAGRIFLASNEEDASTVYFSQVLQGQRQMKERKREAYDTYGYGDIESTTADYTMFFTEQPSWSLRDPSVVPDDGGYVKLTGADEILALTGYRNSVFVFTKNGVWRIFGRDEVFAANDYGVEKISDAGIISKKAQCVFENLPVYASDNGIYILIPDQVSGDLIAYSITDNKIDNLYSKIPLESRMSSKLYYERNNKLLFYLYNSSKDKVLTGKERYGDILIYNTKLNAWFKRTFNKETKPNYRISSMFFVPSFRAAYEGEERETYRTFVLLNDGVENYTIGVFEGEHLYDFYSSGKDKREKYKSYLVSAHQLFGDISRMKQLPYIHFLFKNVETGEHNELLVDKNPSDAILRTSLGFTATPYLIKDEFGELYIKNAHYGKERYIYPKRRNKYDKDRDYLLYTHRLLGRGKVIQFHISNRRDETSFICLNDNVNTLPTLDFKNWEEIEYNEDYEHWDKDKTYNKGDKIKIEIEYDFDIVGWACELVPNQKGSGNI